MNTNRDANYEFSEKVMNAMEYILSNPDLGEKLLHIEPGSLIEHTITILRCLSETADTWFFPNSLPRTVMYAVLINTVYEYIADNDSIHDTTEFWSILWTSVTRIHEDIQQMSKNIKGGEKIDIDEMHVKFRKDLDVVEQ